PGRDRGRGLQLHRASRRALRRHRLVELTAPCDEPRVRGIPDQPELAPGGPLLPRRLRRRAPVPVHGREAARVRAAVRAGPRASTRAYARPALARRERSQPVLRRTLERHARRAGAVSHARDRAPRGDAARAAHALAPARLSRPHLAADAPRPSAGGAEPPG